MPAHYPSPFSTKRRGPGDSPGAGAHAVGRRERWPKHTHDRRCGWGWSWGFVRDQIWDRHGLLVSLFRRLHGTVVLLIAGAVDELRDALAVHGRQSTDAFGPDGAELGNEVGRRKGDGGGGGSRGAAGKAELTHCVDGGDQLVVGVAEVLVGKAQLGVRARAAWPSPRASSAAARPASAGTRRLACCRSSAPAGASSCASGWAGAGSTARRRGRSRRSGATASRSCPGGAAAAPTA